MNEMKAKALEKLMTILDQVLGEDVVGRMKGKVEEATEGKMHEKKEGSEVEAGEEESEESSVIPPTNVIGSAMKEDEKKPTGVGMEISKVEVAAMPKPGLMKKMRGLK